jgi:hypothetical protein
MKFFRCTTVDLPYREVLVGFILAKKKKALQAGIVRESTDRPVKKSSNRLSLHILLPAGVYMLVFFYGVKLVIRQTVGTQPPAYRPDAELTNQPNLANQHIEAFSMHLATGNDL